MIYIASLGFFCLMLGLLMPIFVIYSRRYETSLILTALLYCTAFFSYTYLNLKSGTFIGTIHDNSSPLLPFIYKISGVWSSHEGSLLLWIWFHSIWIYIGYLSFEVNKKLYALAVSILISFYSAYLVTLSNPFEIFFELSTSSKGLNPLLQDPGLAIHPPILYVGTSGGSVLFILVMISRWDSSSANFNYHFIKTLYKFALISIFFLSIGIMLGSWWAYHELGWGGWWFWDPVENMALLPWVFTLALIHYLQIFLKSPLEWNQTKSLFHLLAGGPYIASSVGLFLVRGGLLESVHSFAFSPEKGAVLGLWCVFLTLVYAFSSLRKESFSRLFANINLMSVKGFSLVSALLLTFSGLGIAYYTLLPNIVEILFDRQIVLGASAYNKLLAPVACLGLFLYGFHFVKKESLYIVAISFIITFCTMSFYSGQSPYVYVWVGISGSLFLTFGLIWRLLKTKKITRDLLSHMGFSILTLSVLINTYFTEETQSIITVGETLILDNRVYLIREVLSQTQNYYNVLWGNIYSFDTYYNNDVIFFPEKRYYNTAGMFVHKSVIFTNFFQDLYITIGEGNNDSGFFLRAFKAPATFGLWFSGILIGFGIFGFSHTNISFKIKKYIWW